MSDFTQGPWTTMYQRQSAEWVVRDQHDQPIAWVDRVSAASPIVEAANARLIAAAPDLYAACHALVAGFTPETEEGENDPDIAQGLRAIRKAEGTDR